MPYTFATWEDLKNALVASRLGDNNRIYWSDVGAPYSELSLILAEAVRTFSCLTGYFRERATFNTVAGTAFYDLTTECPAQLSYSLQDRDLVALMEYHLIEPLSVSGSWLGSAQYTIDDFSKAVQRRRNQFLADTGCALSRTTLNVPGSPIGRVVLPDDVIQIQRLAWIDGDTGTITPIWPSSEYVAQGNLVQGLWTNPTSPPLTYSILPTPPLTIQLIPPPLADGQLDVTYVATGQDLNLAIGVSLGIPDDFAWVVKWGALADLLFKETLAYDPIRAAFCESRYRLGVAIAKQLGCVVQAFIDGVPLYTSTLSGIDTGTPYWQAQLDKPAAVALVGNMLAVAPAPDAIYSVTVDLIRKAPIPTSDGDFLPFGREQVDAILDYASHLASFKQAGAEFDATLPQAEAFFKNAISYNSRIESASLLFPAAVREQSKGEYWRRQKERAGKGVGTVMEQEQ